MTERAGDSIEIMVELYEEGTHAWMLTRAEQLGNGLYRVLPERPGYAEPDLWAFPPGSSVRLLDAAFHDGMRKLATHSDSSCYRIEIECSDVFGLRTTYAKALEGGVFRVLPTPSYQESERWAFPPGTLVKLKTIAYQEMFPCVIACNLDDPQAGSWRIEGGRMLPFTANSGAVR